MRRFCRNCSLGRTNGFTLLELVVAVIILSTLSLLAAPLVYLPIKRAKEKELRRALWEIRDAIDTYKESAERGYFQTEVDSRAYPKDLDTLVKGVNMNGGQRRRFLRRIPKDPMTNSFEWGLRSNQDDLDSGSWGGQGVFDVYTKSEKTALDGTKYKDW